MRTPVVPAIPARLLWALIFSIVVVYVAARMGAFQLESGVATSTGVVSMPNTYATVDHPFHVARAEILWRELAQGRILRWIGQHQGGYPAEFYPLGAAWLEVSIRGLSLGALTAAGAHTLAIVAIFLLPGAGFLALAREDGISPAAALLALVFHISLPGGWYDGGYTELVQWGLVTNVAGATATFLMLPPLLRFLTGGPGWAGSLAAVLAAFAVYANPRSALGLVAVSGGALIVAAIRLVHERSPSPPTDRGKRQDAISTSGDRLGEAVPVLGARTSRSPLILVPVTCLAAVGLVAALLSAPLLLSLARFGGLYAFVHYDRYVDVGAYLTRSVGAVTPLVVVLAVAGVVLAIARQRLGASQAAALSLLLYAIATLAVAFVPAVARLAPQLEPTRLMPLQRLMTIYLAAIAVWSSLVWIEQRWRLRGLRIAEGVTVGIAVVLLIALTRPITGAAPDPASPIVPAAGLYSVTTSAQPAQANFEAAIRAANAAAAPGTALLVLGSALSWHQPLWAPLWTERPLFYDNWLWYWHPDHSGTPGYSFLAGHHYPDPEAALEPVYLARHGIGAVVVTGPAREAAAVSPSLLPERTGIFNVYTVAAPTTTITFNGQNAGSSVFRNGLIAAVSDGRSTTAVARANWFSRWAAEAGGSTGTVSRLADGAMEATLAAPADAIALRYTVQPLDWLGRILSIAGLVGLLGLALSRRLSIPWMRRWYAAPRDGLAIERGRGYPTQDQEE